MDVVEGRNGIRRAAGGWVRACAAAGVLALGALLPMTAVQAAAAPLGFSIESPTAGSTVADPVQLKIGVTGTRIGPPSSGYDHLHVRVDGGEVQAVYKNRTLELQLPPGKHRISVDLADPTHEPLLPWQTVTFTVR
ncbi:MAG TPA: hypothetical protein VFQ88_04145 [Nevskiaceae bacterium]|nr:hypothetical protein [Nevskiaceae bacterium]